MSVRIGIALREDAAALAAISAQEYDSWTAEHFLSSMDSPVAKVWTAYEAGKPVGYAVVYYDSDGSELVQIAVDRYARRRGVGTALLNEIVGFLRAEGVPQIILEVRARNEEAIAFYAQRGFRKLTIQKDYYRNPADDALRLMRKINDDNATA